MASADYVADTSVFARLAKPFVAAQFATLAATGKVAICSPVAFEIGFSARNLEDSRTVADRLTSFPFLAVTDADHRRALDVQAELAVRGQHRALSLVDALVAAIAEARRPHRVALRQGLRARRRHHRPATALDRATRHRRLSRDPAIPETLAERYRSRYSDARVRLPGNLVALLKRSLRVWIARGDARLILTCGLPGSGKTTLARRLAADRGAVRLTKDEWLWALGSTPWDAPIQERVEHELRQLAVEILRPPARRAPNRSGPHTSIDRLSCPLRAGLSGWRYRAPSWRPRRRCDETAWASSITRRLPRTRIAVPSQWSWRGAVRQLTA